MGDGYSTEEAFDVFSLIQCRLTITPVVRAQYNVSAQKVEFWIWGYCGQPAKRYIYELCDILKKVLGRQFQFRFAIGINDLAGHF